MDRAIATAPGRNKSFVSPKGAKLLFVVLTLHIAVPPFVDRVIQLGLSFKLLLFLGLWVITTACFLSCCFVKHFFLRWTLAAVLGVSAGIVVGYEAVYQSSFTYLNAFILVMDRGAGLDALRMYPISSLHGLISIIVTFFAVGLKPPSVAVKLGRFAALIYLLPIPLLLLVLVLRSGGGLNGLHPGWVGLGYASYLGLKKAQWSTGNQRAVEMNQTGPAAARDIILIVDESIAGQYLDINDPAGAYSGLSRSLEDASIHNFGLATSATNCSYGSNMALRYGGFGTEFQKNVKNRPSIWSFAKVAGFRTHYIYPYAGFEPYLTEDQLRSIDRPASFDHMPLIERDQKAAEAMRVLLNNDESDFVFVNKMGGHFSVNRSYPADRTFYRPALSRDRLWDLDGNSVELFPSIIQQPDDWRLYRNSYRNALHWNVGTFFDRIFKDSDLSDAIIIYTADHGQNLHEKSNPAKGTHCATYPIIEEAIVPLVLIAGGNTSGKHWHASAVANKDKLTHSHIFPTLLSFMGYSSSKLTRRYGETMDGATPDRPSYLINVTFDGGVSARSVEFDMVDVARPLVSDVER